MLNGGYLRSRDKGGFMKLTTPFTALRNATSDMWRMHDFNYQLPKKELKKYWDQECIAHPTNNHCKIYCD